jgi:hypothetical protein
MPGGDGEGFGVAAVETASCAIVMLATKSSATAVVKTFFIEIFEKWIFQNCDWLLASRWKRRQVKAAR